MDPPTDEWTKARTVTTLAKCYSIVASTLLFYDYLLTLQDEVQYMWGQKKSWVFYLFLINRYFPMIYGVWAIVVANDFFKVFEVLRRSIIIQSVFIILSTLVAQVFMIVRTFALARGNRKVLAMFILLAAVQFSEGVIFMALPKEKALMLVHDSDTWNYRVSYAYLSLGFDVISFLTVTGVSYSTCGPRSNWSTLLRTLVDDSALYFLVILVSHSLMVVNLYFWIPSTNMFAQMMISRLVLNLRMVSDRGTNVSERVSRPTIMFAPNPELPARTQTQVSISEMAFSFDVRDSIISSPPPTGDSPRVD